MDSGRAPVAWEGPQAPAAPSMARVMGAFSGAGGPLCRPDGPAAFWASEHGRRGATRHLAASAHPVSVPGSCSRGHRVGAGVKVRLCKEHLRGADTVAPALPQVLRVWEARGASSGLWDGSGLLSGGPLEARGRPLLGRWSPGSFEGNTDHVLLLSNSFGSTLFCNFLLTGYSSTLTYCLLGPNSIQHRVLG